MGLCKGNCPDGSFFRGGKYILGLGSIATKESCSAGQYYAGMPAKENQTKE